LVAYGRIAGVDAIERVSSHAEDGARLSDESLGALVEARPGAAVIVEPSVLSALPPTERIGLGILAARRDVSIIATAAPDPGDAVSRQTSVRAWQDWMVNLAQAARLAALIRGAGPHHRPLRVAVALNSEMIAGSEIYGVMLARNLTRLGVQVDLLIPNCTPYGDDADVGPLNALLRGHGLSPAIAAPYVYGDRFNGMNPAEQAAALSGIDAFLLAGRYDIVVSSAYIPALTGLPKRRYLAITALFQASAYRQSDLAGLRGQVSGIISDSAWSLRTSSRVIGGPAAVVRSTTPFQGTPPVRSFVDSTRLIRIAVGGTLQPRKRQIEAIAAVGLLVRRGFSVGVKLYGHELSLLQAYIDQLDDQIVKEGLIGRVRRKGLRDLDEIALENDIILSASIDESLPQTLIELMARGLVAVCGLSGGIDELVRDGETGYLTRDLSAGGLADALQRAIEDRGRWGEIRTAAFALIAEDYSEGATTTALLNLLIEAAAIEAAPSGRLTGVGA
jgi:glycosyltransferase involved in cell wall biosynthesis